MLDKNGCISKTERAEKQEARQNSAFKASEIMYQRVSKQNARQKKNGCISRGRNVFYSHFHGKDDVSSSDGISILIDFPTLEDLISYLYALCDSMAIDAV